jgi:uncharacterized Tic20 family protein
MSDGFVSLIRTGVAIVVGALITWLAARNFEVDATAQEALTYGLTSVVTVVYYGLVRWGESQWPMLGVLLGIPKTPAYVSKSKPAAE